MDSYAREKMKVMKKNVTSAYLLWVLLGSLGLHRFYCRKSWGWVYILFLALGFLTATFGIGFVFFLIIGIWWVVDAFLIYKWVERYNLGLITSLEQQHIINEKKAAKPSSQSDAPKKA